MMRTSTGGTLTPSREGRGRRRSAPGRLVRGSAQDLHQRMGSCVRRTAPRVRRRLELVFFDGCPGGMSALHALVRDIVIIRRVEPNLITLS